jgi:tetratricopeptide (TPR) repeat protein
MNPNKYIHKAMAPLLQIGIITLCVTNPPGHFWRSSAQQIPPTKQAALPEQQKKQGKIKADSARDNTDTSDRSTEKETCLLLLRQAVSEIPGLEDEAYTARLQALAADTLWGVDRENAVRLFQEAFDYAVAAPAGSKRKITGKDSIVAHDVENEGGDLALYIISLAVKRDATLGGKFMDKYKEYQQKYNTEGKRNKGDIDIFGMDSLAANNLLAKALELLEVDHKLSIKIARQAFAFSVPQYTHLYFVKLANIDRQMADILYLETLNTVQKSNNTLPSHVLLLSAYPFGEQKVTVTDGAQYYSYSAIIKGKFQINGPIIDNFLRTASGVLNRHAILNGESAINVSYLAAKVIKSYVDKYYPKLSVEWQDILEKIASIRPPKDQPVMERVLGEVEDANLKDGQGQSQSGANKNSIDDLLDGAWKIKDPVKRDDYYLMVAEAASNRGDTDKALEIVDKVSDLNLRREARGYFSFSSILRAMNGKRYDSAKKSADNVEVIDERIYLLSTMASLLTKEGNIQSATSILSEAMTLAHSDTTAASKCRNFALLADTFFHIDADRCFDVAEMAAVSIDSADTYDPEQTNLVRRLKFKTVEERRSPVKVSGYDLGKTLNNLSRKDFDRVIAIINSIKSPKHRLLFMIGLLRGRLLPILGMS